MADTEARVSLRLCYSRLRFRSTSWPGPVYLGWLFNLPFKHGLVWHPVTDCCRDLKLPLAEEEYSISVLVSAACPASVLYDLLELRSKFGVFYFVQLFRMRETELASGVPAVMMSYRTALWPLGFYLMRKWCHVKSARYLSDQTDRISLFGFPDTRLVFVIFAVVVWACVSLYLDFHKPVSDIISL